MLDLGKETTVQAMGKTWRVGKLRLSVLEEFIAWIATQIPDPFEGLEKIVPLLDRQEALALIKEAKARKDALVCKDIGHPIIQEFQQTVRGALHLFWLMLKEHQPDVTKDQAFEIALETGMVEVQRAIADG